MTKQVEIAVRFDDILDVQSDVIALKYAQAFYGADHKVADRLVAANLMTFDEIKLQPGESKLIRCHGVIRSDRALFIGTVGIDRFRYDSIRQWIRNTMRILKEEEEPTRHVALTLHGRGFGLEPGAAFLALLSSLVDAVKHRNVPDSLAGISIVEKDAETYLRLKELMAQRFFGETFVNPSPTGAVYSISA